MLIAALLPVPTLAIVITVKLITFPCLRMLSIIHILHILLKFAEWVLARGASFITHVWTSSFKELLSFPLVVSVKVA